MAVVSDIEIRLRADIARLQQDLNNARRSVSGAVSDIKKTLLSMAAGFSLVEIGRQVIQAQREFDKLNASLITATGSVRGAGEAMKALQSFAASTPYSLKEVTEGFLKLRNLGLTPSERALNSYGNTASAMGKNLTQLVEAVADATTGEFERLKEFGIKAKQQGDQVSLTFQGVTTKVGNNAADIENYLMKIGEVNFAGGMKLQADTLDGAISALGDTWDQTLVAFAQSGFGDAVRSGVMALSGALTDLQAIFRAVTGAADEEGKKVKEVSLLHKGLTTFFEAITVLGVNVAYVFKAIGGDIGAFAAQAATLFNGGIKGLTDGSSLKAIREIGSARVAEGARERAAVDATSAAVLGAATKAQAAREKEAADLKASGVDRLAQYKIVAEGAKTATDAEVKASKKAAEEAKKNAAAYEQLNRTLRDRAEGTAREAAGLAPLTEAEKAHLDLTRQLADGKLKLNKVQEDAARGLIDEAGANEVLIRSNKEYADLQQQLADSAKDLTSDRQNLIQSAKQEAEQNEFLVQTFGMAEDAVIRLNAARLIEQETQRLGRDLTDDEIADLQRVIALKERSAKAVADRAELEKSKQFWTDIDKTARDTFISIADGGKNAFQRLKDTAKNVFFDWLYQQTIKKWIINLQVNSSGVMGAAQAAAGGSSGAGAFSSAANLISMGKTIYSGFTTGLAGTLGSWVSSAGSLFGSQAVSAFGAGLTGSSLGASTALGSSGYAGTAAAGAGASAGAYAIPIAGWIAAGMTVANKLYKQGWDATNGTLNTAGKVFGSSILAFNSVLKKIGLSSTAANIFSGQATLSKLFGRKNPEIERQGIQGTFDAAGFTGKAFADILEKGGWFRSDKRYQKLADLDAAQQNSFDATITSMIVAVKGFGGVLGAETSAVDNFSKAIKLTFGKDEAENEKMITDLFAGIGDELAVKLLPNIAKFQQEGESAATTLQRVASNFSAVDVILQALGTNSQTAFRAVGVASIEARERLVALAGGLDAFVAQTDFFVTNFLSQAEQIKLIQDPLNKSLADLGFAGITSADQFKQAVQGLISSGAAATEEGAKRLSGLLAIAPQFKTVADYLKELSDAAAETAKQAEATAVSRAAEIAAQKRDFEIEILELSGNAVGALAARRAIEIAAADETLRPLLAHIHALQDQKTAAEAATLALEKNEDALRKGVDDAFSAAGRAVAAQREQITAANKITMARLAANLTRVNARIADMTKLADAVRGAISTVESDAQQVASRSAARSQVQAAIAIAKASGVLLSVDDLAGALSTLKIDAGDSFSTLAEYQREVARTNVELEVLGALTDKQLTDAQRQLAVLEDQKALAERQYTDEMERLDGILDWAQAEVDAINGVRTDVQSVVAAIAGLKVALQALQQGAKPSNPTGGALTVEQLYRTVLGREGEKAGVDFWKKAFGDVVDASEYAQFIKGAEYELGLKAPPIAYTAPTSGTMTVNQSNDEMAKRMDAKMSRMVEATEMFASQFANVSNGGQSLLTEPV